MAREVLTFAFPTAESVTRALLRAGGPLRRTTTVCGARDVSGLSHVSCLEKSEASEGSVTVTSRLMGWSRVVLPSSCTCRLMVCWSHGQTTDRVEENRAVGAAWIRIDCAHACKVGEGVGMAHAHASHPPPMHTHASHLAACELSQGLCFVAQAQSRRVQPRLHARNLKCHRAVGSMDSAAGGLRLRSTTRWLQHQPHFRPGELLHQ
jgi:hypothetical protein